MTRALLMLIPALIAVESRGRTHAIGDNGKAWGCLQIAQEVLDDVNAADRQPQYKRADCFNKRKSIAIYCRYMNRWATNANLGHEPTQRDAAMIWHWGPGRWNHIDSDGYWGRVKNLL